MIAGACPIASPALQFRDLRDFEILAGVLGLEAKIF
jgi:hypothetical protein